MSHIMNHICGNHRSCRPPSRDPSRLFDIVDRYGNPDPYIIERPTDNNDPRHMTVLTCAGGHPCPYCFNFHVHLNEIVIAVDGACRFNGRNDTIPRSSFGVFVAKHSPYNSFGKLPDVYTNQVAELQAGLRGLWIARQITYEKFGGDLATVVIKADSEYLVKGMTDWILKWRRNGWKTASGKDVVNRRHFEQLLSEVEKLESMGVKVLLWHVRREFNADADHLANLALDT
ncbi:ribonuclease H-like protein [Hyaloscypha variabilis]